MTSFRITPANFWETAPVLLLNYFAGTFAGTFSGEFWPIRRRYRMQADEKFRQISILVSQAQKPHESRVYGTDSYLSVRTAAKISVDETAQTLSSPACLNAFLPNWRQGTCVHGDRPTFAEQLGSHREASFPPVAAVLFVHAVSLSSGELPTEEVSNQWYCLQSNGFGPIFLRTPLRRLIPRVVTLRHFHHAHDFMPAVGTGAFQYHITVALFAGVIGDRYRAATPPAKHVPQDPLPRLLRNRAPQNRRLRRELSVAHASQNTHTPASRPASFKSPRLTISAGDRVSAQKPAPCHRGVNGSAQSCNPAD
jgi:hypothetical protein